MASPIQRDAIMPRSGDARPLASRARALFYLLMVLNMHMECSLGTLRWTLETDGWLWPLHESQLGQGAMTWCAVPQQLLDLDGAKEHVDALARAIVPHGAGCIDRMRLLSRITSAAMLLSAFAALLPRGRGIVLTLSRRLPPAMSAAGMLLLDGLFQSCRDTNHRWQLPALCCLAMALDDSSCPSPEVREICVSAAGAMFAAAGWSKLTMSTGYPSLKWATGETLGYHLRGHSSAVATLLSSHQTLLASAAAGTLATELLGVLVVFLPATAARRWLVSMLAIAWAGFHVGVLLAMPNVSYLPSVLVHLLLLLPWAAPSPTAATASTSTSSTASPVTSTSTSVRSVALDHTDDPPAMSAEGARRGMRRLVVSGFAAASLWHVEQWPFTCVPMFSHLRGDWWRADCATAEQLVQLSQV